MLGGAAAEATEHHLRAAGMRKTAGDRAGQAESLSNAGVARAAARDWAGAAARLEEARGLLRPLRDGGARERRVLVNLGIVQVRFGGAVY